MTQSFRCPSCNAPLKVKSGLQVQTCRFCDTDILVPRDAWRAKKREMPVAVEPALPETEKLKDVSDLGQKALKIAEIKQALKGNRTASAAMLFRDSFGGSLADAHEIIRAIEKGESITIPGLQSEGKVSTEKSFSKKRLIFLFIAAIAVILIFIFAGRLLG